MFKAGDKVLCIDPGSGIYKTTLIHGKVYTVDSYSRICHDQIFLDKISLSSWCADRFIPACSLAQVLYSVDARKGGDGV